MIIVKEMIILDNEEVKDVTFDENNPMKTAELQEQNNDAEERG